MPQQKRGDPVLSLAVDNISKIDTVDCERLSSLWTVFTKCAENLENGRRLENLSWRLWYRECQLLDREKQLTYSCNDFGIADVEHKEKKASDSDENPPSLSTSIDSVSTDDEPVSHIQTTVTRLVPEIKQVYNQQHLSPNKFHELVTQFGQGQPQYDQWKGLSTEDISSHQTKTSDKEESVQSHNLPSKKPISNPKLMSAPILNYKVTDSVQHSNTHKSKHLCASSQLEKDVTQGLRRASSVVHGFNPTKAPTIEEPTPTESVASNKKASSKHMFFLDGGASDSDPDPDHEDDEKLPHQPMTSTNKKSNQARSLTPGSENVVKKHTSFREIVDEGSDYDSSPFDSDEESDTEPLSAKHNESAIVSDDEGDDDDWASVGSESRQNSLTSGNMFDKLKSDISSRPRLASQKSILSDLLTNPMTRLSNTHSRSSPAIARSRKVSPTQSPGTADASHNISSAHRAAGLPVIENTVAKGPAFQTPSAPTAIEGSVSPRTTRRNMLASELSESLRRHLLWERKQKSNNTNGASQALLQRRHTAVDLTQVANAAAAASSSFQHYPFKPDDAGGNNEFGYNGAGW